MRLSLFSFFTAITIIIVSCNNETKESIAHKKTVNHLEILDTSKLSSDSLDLQVNRIDTIKYSNLPYWDTTMDRFDSAYIDTFSVDGIQFRFINPSEDKFQLDILIYLEKLVNGHWIYTGFTIGTGNWVNDYYHSRDVNGDGYIDITQDLKWVQAVYFYNPQNKTYDSNNKYKLRDEYYINKDWILLDTTKNIFCDFNDFKQLCSNIHSTLYTYKGFKKVELFDLELYNCSERDDIDRNRFVTKLILSKCEPKLIIKGNSQYTEYSYVTIQEIKLPKPIDLDRDYGVGYFDYVNFWKKNYKEILGYR
jgi:hypothetical protein